MGRLLLQNARPPSNAAAPRGFHLTGSYRFGDPIGPWEPEVGNTVTLRARSVSIIARITAASDREYTGEVIGFERHDDHEYMGLRPGDTLPFAYANIFGCIR